MKYYTCYIHLVGHFLLILACVTYSDTVNAQSSQLNSIHGTVVAADTGEPIVGAAVYLPASRSGTYTDYQGYYSISAKSNLEGKLYISYPGYISDSLAVDRNEINARLEVQLSEAITVTASRLKYGSTGVIDYQIPNLEKLPQLLGEPDLLKSLSASPGVQEGVEGTAGISIRGGSDDQNLYLLDGSTIYNPGHVFGFISLYHPAAVQHLRLYKGYIPPKFSGRLSSTIDVGIKLGNHLKSTWKASFGPITNSLLLEGPFRPNKHSKNRKTFLVSARIANTIPFTLISQALGTTDESKTRILAGMYDFTAKFTIRYGNGGALDVSTYLGDDFWGGRSTDPNGDRVGEEVFWGNKIMALRYHRPLSANVIYEGRVNLNEYKNNYLNFQRGAEVDKSITNRGSIKEARTMHQLTVGRRWITTNTGIELAQQFSHPITFEFTEVGVEKNSNTNNFAVFYTRAFFTTGLSVSSLFKLDLGLSLGYLNNHSSRYSGFYLEPRVGLQGNISPLLSYGLSYTRTAQTIHRISNFAIGLPYDIWLPANHNLPIETAEQFAAELTFKRKDFSIVLGAFSKSMNHLVYPPNKGIFPTTEDNLDFDLTERIVGNGIGRSFGGELSTTYTTTSSSTTFSYTYSRSFRSFTELNLGQEFVFDFDRPHVFDFNQQIKLSDKWEMNARFVYQSGRPLTIPTEVRINTFGQVSLEYPAINNYRLKPYHRLDLAFSKNFVTKKKSRSARLTLGIYNIYARRNPVRAYVEEIFDLDNAILTYPIGYTVKTSSFLLFIPSINYTLEW